jgi:hypothetical protein
VYKITELFMHMKIDVYSHLIADSVHGARVSDDTGRPARAGATAGPGVRVVRARRRARGGRERRGGRAGAGRERGADRGHGFRLRVSVESRATALGRPTRRARAAAPRGPWLGPDPLWWVQHKKAHKKSCSLHLTAPLPKEDPPCVRGVCQWGPNTQTPPWYPIFSPRVDHIGPT